MAARAFTAKAVEALKPDPERRLEVPDAGLSGLYLVVQPSGAKSWALRYRLAGKPAKLTLGKWPVMSLAEARSAAAEALQEVEHGRDPARAKQASKAAKREAELTKRDKVKTLVEQFDRRHLSALKSGKQARAFLDRFVVDAWGDRDVHTITRRDVVDLIDGIVDSGRAVTANRVLAHARKFFNWCVEREVLQQSPAERVKAPAKEASRDRVLSDDEVKLFWRACDALGQPWGPLGKLLLFTGQRLNEVAQMRDAEIRGDVWHLSAERTKNHRAHDVPLSDAALRVLAGLQPPKGAPGYLHTTTGKTPLSGFHKGRINIAKQMEQLAAADGRGPATIPHWGFHDLRRTAATGMARLGIPVRVTEAVLNHVSGTGGGIVAVYQRHDYADEKRQALEAWARYVTALVESKADNVISIAEARL